MPSVLIEENPQGLRGQQAKGMPELACIIKYRPVQQCLLLLPIEVVWALLTPSQVSSFLAAGGGGASQTQRTSNSIGKQKNSVWFMVHEIQ